ncbi:uncharacterized protein RHO17_003532 [Thomomys bottae]
MDLPNKSSCQSVEAQELQEEVQDEKPTVTLVTGGGGDEIEEKIWQEDEQGEAGDGSCLVAGAQDTMKEDDNPMGSGSGKEEPGSQPVDVDNRVPHSFFKELDVNQLEHVFLRIKFPGMFAGEDLSINWSATEVECWSVNRKTNDLPGQQS